MDDMTMVENVYFADVQLDKKIHDDIDALSIDHWLLNSSPTLTGLDQTNKVQIENPKLLEKETKATKLYKNPQRIKQQNQKLKRMLDELMRSNQELEQFAYIASHALQEPLRMVASFTQLLERRYGDVLDKDGKEFIQYAVEGTKRMQALLHDVLHHAKLSQETSPFKTESLEAILGLVLNNLSVIIAEQKTIITHDPLPVIHANQIQIIQLLQNLILNAIKFQPPNQVAQIHISANMKEKDWLFSVQDNGIGIEATSHDKLFVMFQRLHPTNDYQGTGIGLAVCKKIVERHGGRIWVESNVGRGCTFYFTLPRSVNSSDTEAPQGSPI